MGGFCCTRLWTRALLCAASCLGITPARWRYEGSSASCSSSASCTCCYALACCLLLLVLLASNVILALNLLTSDFFSGTLCFKASIVGVQPFTSAFLMAEVVASAFLDRGHWLRVFALLEGPGTVMRPAPWLARVFLGLLTCLFAALTAHVIRQHLAQTGEHPMLIPILLYTNLSHIRRFLQTLFVQVTVLRLYGTLRVLGESLEIARLGTHGQSSARERRHLIREVKQRYARLHATTNAFSSIFSWRIMLMFTESFMRMLTTCTMFLKGFPHTDFFSGLAFQSLGITIITMSCDIASVEGEKFIERIEDMLDDLPWDGRRKDVHDLLLYVKTNRINFTAGGFFKLDRQIMFTFLSVVTSYLIVALQMC